MLLCSNDCTTRYQPSYCALMTAQRSNSHSYCALLTAQLAISHVTVLY